VIVVVVLIWLALVLLVPRARERARVRAREGELGSGARTSRASIVAPRTSEANKQNLPTAMPVWPSTKRHANERRHSLSRSESSYTSEVLLIMSSLLMTSASGLRVLRP
jgi:hypothetical protein